MADPTLEELFARLKSTPSSNLPIQEPPIYQPPTVSSPIFSPPARATPPIHSSDVLSPAIGTPMPDQRTSNLLNLLKFNGQGSASQASAQPASHAGSRPSSGAGLVGSLRRSDSNTVLPSPYAGLDKSERISSPSVTQKDYLLNLLNRPKESVTATTTPITAAQAPPTVDDGVEKLVQNFAATSVAAPQPKSGIFAQVNPFEELHASSPLNQSSQPVARAGPKKFEILKHERDVSSSMSQNDGSPANKSRKIDDENSAAATSSSPVREKGQSVSEALEGVGEKVDKQVEEALAQAEGQGKPTVAAIGSVDSATAGDNTAVKKKSQPDHDEIESSWESAEDEEEKGEYDVAVYNFPMKPFVSIQINSAPNSLPIRQDNFMVIAQLKKEFDQVDRCLVSATQTYIMYGQMATKKDNGGLRLIRQDSGDHKQVFRASGERIFSVQFCSSNSDVETALGTGVKGSIFWTSLAKSRGDLFAEDDVEAHGFIMPAVATQEEQTSGSPIKTRAKMSSRHPEFFAISRGKQIHIIAPEMVKDKAYCNPKTRKINSEKYLAEHSLKILTGKAGKDFCFSEDDTMIVSLDKSGRLKFWDIRELTSRATDLSEGKHEPIELKEPTWSFSAAASGSKPDEKPSVSSVMFIDKEKPTAKGSALRYLIIGFKQNHILQLYDLHLKKPVQEVRLPHEKDSDGFCSITYHPRTGIIAVGHPTRNSIYFIHLSAPKYNLGVMEQARFTSILATDDGNGLPKPESTAIMSGVREFSFSKVGQLRSLDMLREPVDDGNGADNEDSTLFELYVMHSKGVVGIGVKRKDLGWDMNNRMIKPLDAVETGFASVQQMEQLLPKPSSEQSSVAESTVTKQSPAKKPEPAKATPVKSDGKKEVKPPAATGMNGTSGPTELASDEVAREIKETPASSHQSTATLPSTPSGSYAMAAQRAKSPVKDKIAHEVSSSAKTVHPAPSVVATAPASQTSGNLDLQSMISRQFDALYHRIDGDKRVQDAAGAAKQDAVLRLISTSLTENVESSLNRIVTSSIQKEVLPNLNNTTGKAIDKKLAETLPQQLNNAIAKEVKAALPGAIQHALKDPQIQRTISDQVASKVHQQVSNLLQQSMPNIATQATNKMLADLEGRTSAKLREAENRRQEDKSKIQELADLVTNLSQIIQTMSETQAAYQEQMLRLQSAKDEQARDSAAAEDQQAQVEDEEVKKITQMLVNRQYDAATLEWLQSARQGEIFDQVFVRVNPQYLELVSPLIALSVSAAITATFDTNVDKRLEWLGSVLTQIDLQDHEIRDVAPKIMDVLSHRLQGAYMQISEENPSDPTLRRISALNRQVNEVRRLTG